MKVLTNLSKLLYIYKPLLALAIAMLLTSTIAFSQSSTFTNPVNESENVELIPTLKLHTDNEILRSSFKKNMIFFIPITDNCFIIN